MKSRILLYAAVLFLVYTVLPYLLHLIAVGLNRAPYVYLVYLVVLGAMHDVIYRRWRRASRPPLSVNALLALTAVLVIAMIVVAEVVAVPVASGRVIAGAVAQIEEPINVSTARLIPLQTAYADALARLKTPPTQSTCATHQSTTTTTRSSTPG